MEHFNKFCLPFIRQKIAKRSKENPTKPVRRHSSKIHPKKRDQNKNNINLTETALNLKQTVSGFFIFESHFWTASLPKVRDRWSAVTGHHVLSLLVMKRRGDSRRYSQSWAHCVELVCLLQRHGDRLLIKVAPVAGTLAFQGAFLLMEYLEIIVAIF